VWLSWVRHSVPRLPGAAVRGAGRRRPARRLRSRAERGHPPPARRL